MLALPYIGAAATSSLIRICESFLPIGNNADRYMKREINFEQATDHIVKNICMYTTLVSAKIVCDAIVLSMTGQWLFNVLIHIRSIFKSLLNCRLEAFINGIKLSLEHFFVSLKNCSITLILSQFKYLYDKQKNIISSISILNFCNICNQIYFLLIASTGDLKKTIQLDIVKYWLECMGIIRAVAECLNINIIKYMNQSFSKEINGNTTTSANNEQSFNLPEIQWIRVKDPDFFQFIDISLEDIFYGRQYDVKVNTEIREIDKRKPIIQEEKHTVIIEPGCLDGKEFRFAEAGHRDPVNIPGDLVVKIRTVPHQIYERVGSDLIYKATISLEDTRNGTSLRVPLINGEMMECDLYKNTVNSNKEIIIDHAGLPDTNNGGIRGRLIVKWDIELPDAKTGIEPTE